MERINLISNQQLLESQSAMRRENEKKKLLIRGNCYCTEASTEAFMRDSLVILSLTGLFAIIYGAYQFKSIAITGLPSREKSMGVESSSKLLVLIAKLLAKHLS